MSEKFKLGLTRNRLFEFENCVSFLGRMKEDFDGEKCHKAFRTLLLKEPILSCGIELCENGDAYLVTDVKEPSLDFFQGDEQSFVENMKVNGFDFCESLFSFVILNNRTFAVFAHTVVADVRSLMYLADEFMNIYRNEIASVVPSDVIVLSEISQLPTKAFSVVAEKLSADLEIGWQKKTKTFTYDDFKNARDKYLSLREQQGSISFEFDESEFQRIKGFASGRDIDASSVVALAFYENLKKTLGGRRKYRKLNIQVNERVFFDEGHKMQVGAYNGVITVAKTKNKKISDTFENKAEVFHGEIYKRFTSVHAAFYNEILFMKLPASFVDSQYMYCSGVFRHKSSKKLATVYGCANEVAGEFCSYNLNQKKWRNIASFDEVVLSEPLKMRSTTLISFVEKGNSATIRFDYKKSKISDESARKLVGNVVELLKKIK